MADRCNTDSTKAPPGSSKSRASRAEESTTKSIFEFTFSFLGTLRNQLVDYRCAWRLEIAEKGLSLANGGFASENTEFPIIQRDYDLGARSHAHAASELGGNEDSPSSVNSHQFFVHMAILTEPVLSIKRLLSKAQRSS